MRLLLLLVLTIFCCSSSVDAAEKANCQTMSCEDDVAAVIGSRATGSIVAEYVTAPDYTCLQQCNCTGRRSSGILMDQVCRTMGAPSAFNAQITAFSVAANPDYTILDQMKVNDPSSYISGLEASIRSWNNFKLCRHQPDCMVDGSPVAAGKNLALPQSGLDACKKFNGTAFSCVAATSQPGAMSIDCASLPVGTGRSMCNVVNADGFDLVAFNKYYTDSHLTSRDDVAEVIALAKGYKGSPSGVDACVDYVKGYVAGDSVTPGVWSWSRYRMLVHCKLALSAYNSTQLINDLTAWQLADCSGAASCDAVSDPDLKVFCTGSPDPYPWPLSSSVP